MLNKKVVDDYYSNITVSNNSDINSSKDSSKPKIKGKKISKKKSSEDSILEKTSIISDIDLKLEKKPKIKTVIHQNIRTNVLEKNNFNEKILEREELAKNNFIDNSSKEFKDIVKPWNEDVGLKNSISRDIDSWNNNNLEKKLDFSVNTNSDKINTNIRTNSRSNFRPNSNFNKSSNYKPSTNTSFNKDSNFNSKPGFRSSSNNTSSNSSSNNSNNNFRSSFRPNSNNNSNNSSNNNFSKWNTRTNNSWTNFNSDNKNKDNFSKAPINNSFKYWNTSSLKDTKDWKPLEIFPSKWFSNNSFKWNQNNNNLKKNKFIEASEKIAKKTVFKKWKFNFTNDEDIFFSRSNKLSTKKKQEKSCEDIKQDLVSRIWEIVIINEILSIKELSEKLGVPLPKLMGEFMKNWIFVNINTKIDFDSASIIADSFDIRLEKENSNLLNVKDLINWDLKSLCFEDDTSKLKARAPIISIMWHVDHWKTSLLDYIRSSKLTLWEAGGITQSIGAYQIEHNSQKITFLDTPWHEAFSIMRARWAKLTDIAILVVAADDWVKPQTIESINHAREADISIIVAINKIDKHEANPEQVKRQLSEHWLLSEDWWGDIPMIPVSAHTWFWVDDLLEMILLISEMKELKANPERPWLATVIESHLDPNLWAVATLLINSWNINKWDNIVCSDSFWKIKILKNYDNISILKAFPGDPILIVWLDNIVSWGDILQVVSSQEIAKSKANEFRQTCLDNKITSKSWIDILMSKIKIGNLKSLKLVVKSNSNWSLEALKWALAKLSTKDTDIQIIHSWVWNITEWDVIMCQWSVAILVSYAVSIIPAAKKIIDSWKVEIIESDIIYNITDKIEKIITWMFNPKEVELVLWKAKVAWIFFTDKTFMVIWLKLEEWNKIENKVSVRVFRNKNYIWNWKIISLKNGLLDVKDLEWPTYCWIKLETSLNIEMDDVLEIYKMVLEK